MDSVNRDDHKQVWRTRPSMPRTQVTTAPNHRVAWRQSCDLWVADSRVELKRGAAQVGLVQSFFDCIIKTSWMESFPEQEQLRLMGNVVFDAELTSIREDDLTCSALH